MGPLIVGLGNPTDKYKHNRHNIGFMVIDALVNDLTSSNITKSIFTIDCEEFPSNGNDSNNGGNSGDNGGDNGVAPPPDM